jgi:hypothetical protein
MTGSALLTVTVTVSLAMPLANTPKSRTVAVYTPSCRYTWPPVTVLAMLSTIAAVAWPSPQSM